MAFTGAAGMYAQQSDAKWWQTIVENQLENPVYATQCAKSEDTSPPHLLNATHGGAVQRATSEVAISIFYLHTCRL